VELFERPRHTFVGHFIGSPGMNLLPCETDAAGMARLGGVALAQVRGGRGNQVGVRPEYVRFAEAGLPVRIERVSDVGRHRIVDARHGEHLIKALVAEGTPLPAEQSHVAFDPAHTHVYADGWLVESAP
jgi:glycerol transport system ATP-binding protein